MFFLFARAAFSIRSVSHEKHQFGSYEQTCCNGSNHMVSMWKTCELRIMGNGIALLLCKWEKWGTHTMKKKWKNCTELMEEFCFFKNLWYSLSLIFRSQICHRFLSDAEFYSDQNASEKKGSGSFIELHFFYWILARCGTKNIIVNLYDVIQNIYLCWPEELHKKKIINQKSIFLVLYKIMFNSI